MKGDELIVGVRPSLQKYRTSSGREWQLMLCSLVISLMRTILGGDRVLSMKASVLEAAEKRKLHTDEQSSKCNE